MHRNLFILVDGGWLLGGEQNARRIAEHALCPVGPAAGHLRDGCCLLIKFKDHTPGTIVAEGSARIQVFKEAFYVKCEGLCRHLQLADLHGKIVAFFIEGSESEARCVVDVWEPEFLSRLESIEPALRFQSYDIPPTKATVVEAPHIVEALYREASAKDPDLFALHAARFLDAPHILTALFSHLFSMRTEENIHFPIVVKKLAEQLRASLETAGSKIRIGQIRKSHLDMWSEVEGERFAFVDGGVARIASLPGIEPLALRVGVYSVRPGVEEPEHREQWSMHPYVIGDLLDGGRRLPERADPKRLQEAARYTLEALTALLHLREHPETRALLIHGPLVNAFQQYDEGPPNYVPFLAPGFLNKIGIDEGKVSNKVQHIPGEPSMWNQFMAIYAYLMQLIDECTIPVVGVVERPVGRAVTTAVMDRLERERVFTAAYKEAAIEKIEQYDITDDFLFGCILKEGEYLTPIEVDKNLEVRARDRWKPVVAQYPRPSAMLVKSEESNFPFRVEMNRAAAEVSGFIARFLYHTARLLPRYAFPVGLDIVDKYAKVPDWLSRGVSASLSAGMLRRAMNTGDPRLVSQVRLLLARGPRDFFFRPKAQ
ncbi:MAG: DNA double-strand break repair nuclease NurA [Acidobacteriota bacterium]